MRVVFSTYLFFIGLNLSAQESFDTVYFSGREFVEHVVKGGESLKSIAALHRVESSEIISQEDLKLQDLVSVEQGEVEQGEVEQEEVEQEEDLREIDLNVSDLDDSVSLKQPNDIYIEIYKAARDKARHMRDAAIEAFLEAKKIKLKYQLDMGGDSEDENSDISNNEENEEKPN